ncbi:MAG TPA: Ig-like domain-containing protein, partial [Methylomirabilota bacterium]|nr:Ig-like domain-containing protein [Methylomirabilota bacterium]
MNTGSVTVGGVVEPGARVDVVLQDVGLVAAALADGAGAFSLPVALAENAVNELLVFGTPHGGDGLTGPPASAEVVHDGVAPSVTFLEPTANAFVRQTVTVRARAEDAGSGVASVALSLDGQALGSQANPDPAQPFTAALSVDTTLHADGAHTLAAAAQDRAGNGGASSRTIIVDNTPPDTEVTGGPSGPTPATATTFTFGGSDNLTPAASLVFSWRLDAGAWSAFAGDTTASFTELAAGPHAFEVRAQDLAGNEDATPAVRSFTVGSSVRITITEPLEGATVAAGMLVVRGTLQEAAGEVGVVVNGLPAAVHGDQFAAAVPVTAETSSVVAVATTAAGATASHTIAIGVPATGDSLLTLHATPATGVAPLTVAF